MKKYAKAWGLALILAGMFLCIGTVSAAGQIAIDPVPGNLTTGSILVFTGTTMFPAGTNLHYEFSREGTGTGLRSGEYSGAEGTIAAEKGSAGGIWKVPILSNGYSPGEYLFTIGDAGSVDRVSVRVRLVEGVPVTMVTTPTATPDAPLSFESPMYVSPGGNFAVETNPNLTIRRSSLAKGTPFTITVATSPGNPVGIWMTSGFPVREYTHFETITADGSGHGKAVLPDTTAMKSGQYFVYVVDGGKALLVVPGTGNQSGSLSGDALENELKAHEQQNPYQKFMILLEEPAIRITDIPDAAFGSPVDLNGTTNLAAGTLLDVGIFLPDIHNRDQPALTVPGVTVAEGTDGYGHWRAGINTSGMPPGEYILKVRNGSAESETIMVLYDSLYDPGPSPAESLVVRTYAVDPETKTVLTGTPAREAGFPADPGMLVLACPALLIGLGAAARRPGKR